MVLFAPAGAAASPGAAMYGQPAEVLLEGAEYGAETKDAAEASEAEAGEGIHRRSPEIWARMSRRERKHRLQRR